MCIELDFRICLFLLHLHLIKVLPHTLALLPPSSVYAQPPRSDSHILWNKKLRSIFDPRTHIGHKDCTWSSWQFIHFWQRLSFLFWNWHHSWMIHGIFAWSHLLYPRSQWISDFHQVGSSAAVPLIVFVFFPPMSQFSHCSLFSLLLTFFCCIIWLFTPPILGKTSRGGNDVNEMVLCGTF